MCRLPRCTTAQVPICMLVGGACFLGGAVLYWPAWAERPAVGGWTVGRVGTWVFRVGTMAYLAGSGFSLASMLRNWPDRPHTTTAADSTSSFIFHIANHHVFPVF
jgi:hypothetical protein